jgi:DNA-binding transcriptional ArsR family regulator
LDQRLKVLLHPARLRLVHAIRIAGELTTAELCARLPDLPKATIYRHVERLLRGGVLEVASERKVRGVSERRLCLAAGATVSVEDARDMREAADHRQAFTAAMAALMADFNVYLDRADARPFEDEVSYRQFVVWLTPDERSRLIAELTRIVIALSGNSPGGKRMPHVLSTVFFPASSTDKNPSKPGSDRA